MELRFPADNDFFPDLIRFISNGYTWNYNVFWSLPNWPVSPPPKSAGFIWDLPFWRLGNIITPEHRAYCESVGIPIIHEPMKYAMYGKSACEFDVVFTASEYQRDIIKTYWGIDPLVIKMPYRETEIAWAKASPLYHKPPTWMDRPYCIQVGRNDWHKGFDRSIDYFNRSSIPETHDLVFVFPDGPMVRSEHELHDLCDKDTRLRIFHQLPYAEVIRYIHHAELLLSPTAFEGMNQPPFEAFLTNTNFIISDIGVHREYWPVFNNECLEIYKMLGLHGSKIIPLDWGVLWPFSLGEVLPEYHPTEAVKNDVKGNYSFAAYADRLAAAGIVSKKCR